MKCPYCASKASVFNSRSTANGTQTWRRRRCKTCNSIWSTKESVNLEDTHSITSETASEPFSRDKLFVSIKASLKHREASLAEATALTDTIINKTLLLRTPSIESTAIKEITYKTLYRFDKVAAAVYKATYGLK